MTPTASETAIPALTTERAPSRLAGRWLMHLARRGGLGMVLAVALPLASGALLLPQSWLLAHVLQQAIVERAEPTSLLGALVAIGVLIGVRALLSGSGEAAAVQATEAVKQQVREALAGSLMRHRPSFVAARPSGALSAALVEEVDALTGFLARYLPSLVAATLLPLAFAVALIPFDWVAGLLLLVTCPLIPIFMALVGWGAEAANRQHQQALLRLSGFFADRLRGLMTLKLLGRGDSEAERLADIGDELRRRTLAALRIAFLSSAVLEFFAALGVAGVALYVGLTYLGFLDLRGAPLSLATGLFCLLMAPEVYAPLRQFAVHYHDRAAAKAAVEAIDGLFGELPGSAEEPCPTLADRLPEAGALTVLAERLTVMTPAGERPILHYLDGGICAGAHVAIIGESGSGKSTLIETLAGLRDFAGAVEIGGLPLDRWPEGELRRRVAVISQRPHLFRGSIADNIRLGRRDADDAAVLDAAERAGVLRFAFALPQRLETRIGESGIGLSGGEAQRVALARLYLRDPSLILLDEPTAHLDAETERDVLDGLIEFAAGRTLVIATHSRAVTARLDRVYRLAGGTLLPTPVAPARRGMPPVERGAA